MDTSPITPLESDAAWEFLASHEVGRLAVCSLGEPDIFPINYIVSGENIIFRTAQGTKLLSILIDGHVALEVDEYTETEAVSVVAKGVGRLLDSSAEIEELGAERVRPYVPTLKQQFVAIAVQQISGRHFQFGEEPDRLPLM